MSWNDQKPFEVTPEHMKLPWRGKGAEVFRCHLCGIKFQPGMIVRWIWTNGRTQEGRKLPPGNPFVCQGCDVPDLMEQLADAWEQYLQFREKYWWALS